MGRLEGKTIFMTAAAAGIGGAAATAFAREGARVIATDRDAAGIARKGDELQAISAGHEAYPLDVTDHAALNAAAARHPGVNVLYNGAGWVHQGTLETTELEDWQLSFDINVTPMFVLTKAFLPAFIAQGGATIVNIASEIAQQRIATPEDIDAAVMLGLGYPRGPLTWGDAIGPRHLLEILEKLLAITGDPRYRPSLWLRRRALLGLSLTHPED